MKIYTDKRTGIKYLDYMVGGTRRRVSLGTKNGEIALLKARDFVDNKKARDEGKNSFEAFLSRYRAFLKATKSKQTCKIFETALNKLTKFATVREITDITPQKLDDLLISLKNNGDGHAGINRSIRSLRTAVKQAEYWQLAKPQDWNSMIKLCETKHRVEFHTQEEIAIILANINDKDGIVATMLACQAGLRRAETAHAKWAHIDFDNNQIYVPANKTDEYRHIPMTPSLKTVLLDAKSRAQSEYLVTFEGNRESKDYVSSWYTYHTKDLPFHCFYHKLRHTFASHLVQNGADLYYVSKLMGHSSIKMTEKYAHLSQNNLVSTMKLLPQPNVSKIVSTRR